MDASPESALEDGPAEAAGEVEELSAPLLLFLRGALMLGLVFGLVLLAHWYIGRRLFTDPAWPEAVRWSGWTALWALCAMLPLGPLTRRARGSAGAALQWASYLWMGTFGLLIVSVVASDAIAWAARALLHAPASLGWSRAQALGLALVDVPALLLGIATARGRAKVEAVELWLPNLGPAFDGFRIAQVSDLHVGQTLDGRWLSRVVAQVNALDADAVAITGDLVDASPRVAAEQLAPLSGLKATHGAFYVTGNHEYYHGGPVWEQEVARRGVTVLHNEHVVLRRGQDQLVFAGVTDHDAHLAGPAHASSPARALAHAPSDAVRILLAHQPRTARFAQGLGVDLQLSGHTHGGQMFPWMFLVRLQQPTLQGLDDVGGVRVYTHRGTGYWGPPIRLGPAPEIALITLRRAP